MRATACANQVYVVACNCTGTPSGHALLGCSMVVSPWGDVIARLGDEEGTLTASFGLHEIEKSRKNIPLERDRRADLYSVLSPA